MIVIGKMKHKQEFEKKRPKYEAESSRKNQKKGNEEDKIEELRVHPWRWVTIFVKMNSARTKRCTSIELLLNPRSRF